MNNDMQVKLDLFAENTLLIKREFTWHDALTKQMSALLYAQAGKVADCDAIRRCLNLIKEETGIFSVFRGNMALGVATMLSLSPDPRALFEKTMNVYGSLKSVKLYASDFLAVAAFLIAEKADASGYVGVVNRMRDFYDAMKSRHFFYTGEDDYIFAAMLGLADLDPAAGTECIEQLFERLKDEFWAKNSVQTLAQVLVLGGADVEAVNRVLLMRDALRAQNIKLDKRYTLPVLGILALLPVETDVIVRDIGEAYAVLRDQKGFGGLSVTSQELLLLAGSLVAGEYAKNIEDGVITAALSTSIVNILIAQQAAMLAAVSASAAASSSSSS